MRYGHGGDIYTNQGIRLDFSINVNPLGMPDFVKRAAEESIAFCGHYPDPGCGRLRRAAAERYQVGEETLIFGNGAAELIFTSVQALRPASAVLMAPGFTEYEDALKTVGAKLDFFYLKEKDGFELKTERYLEFLEERKPELIFLCNPSNPLGKALEAKAGSRILEYCREHNIFVIADECFLEFLPEAKARSFLAEVRRGNKGLLVLKALTKTFAMPGLRLGYGFCADRLLLDRIECLLQPWNVSIPAQEAGAAAFSGNMEGFLFETMRLLSTERPFLIEKMAAAGFQTFSPEGNFILFRDLPGRPAHRLYQDLLEQGILIRSCGNFRGLGGTYYRICVRRRKENAELLQALDTAADKGKCAVINDGPL